MDGEEATANGERIRYISLEVDAAGMAELDGQLRAVVIPRDRIEGVELRRGIPGERPVAQVVLALVCFAIAGASMRVLDAWWRSGGTISTKMAAGIALGPLGAWILLSAFRPRYYLFVRMKNDARKLVFQGPATRAGLAQFIRRANQIHGYGITSALPGFDLVGTPYR